MSHFKLKFNHLVFNFKSNVLGYKARKLHQHSNMLFSSLHFYISLWQQPTHIITVPCNALQWQKEKHHMHGLHNKTMTRAQWKSQYRSYLAVKKKHAECGIQARVVCVCAEVIWPDGVRVKESVVTCNSSMTPVWGFKIHTPGSWIEPTADLTSV